MKKSEKEQYAKGAGGNQQRGGVAELQRSLAFLKGHGLKRIRAKGDGVCVYVGMCVGACMCVYARACARTYACANLWMRMNAFVCVRVCECGRGCTCVYVR
jgi:hypothetical protein